MAAADQAVAQALAPLGGRAPDLAFVFVSGDPVEASRAAERAAELLGAGACLGCHAHGVLAAGQAVEQHSAVSVFAAVLPGASVRTFHLEVMPAETGAAVMGLPEVGDGDQVAVLIADPFTFPVEGFVSQAARTLPGLRLVGGMAHGLAPGQTRLWVDGRTVGRGAVGVLLGGTGATTLVAQGCRPLGPAMTVTACAGNQIHTLAGAPALEKVREVLGDLEPDEQALASRGLHLGIAADEYAEDHEYLIRSLLGSDGSSLVVGDLIEVGQTVRLQVRDADAARADLTAALERTAGAPGAGAVVFTCNGRGQAMFGPSHGGAGHDEALVRSGLAADAVAGFFAAGEIGPVAGRSHLHGFTASVLVLP